MMFQIKRRFTAEVMFECELSAVAGQEYSLQLGFAVKRAVDARANLADAYLADAYLAGANLAGAYLARANLAGANLADANLADAYLAGAYLAGANLAGAYLVDGGQRSDGYRFVGYIRDGLRIVAGCRDFSISEAREHWRITRGGASLGDETTAILDHIETVARIRGMIERRLTNANS